MNINLKKNNTPSEPGWYGCNVNLLVDGIHGGDNELALLCELHWGTGIYFPGWSMEYGEFLLKYPHALFSDALPIAFTTPDIEP